MGILGELFLYVCTVIGVVITDACVVLCCEEKHKSAVFEFQTLKGRAYVEALCFRKKNT